MGEGGEGGEGGGGGGGFWCSPPTDSPNPLEEAKLHRGTLGLIYGFTQRDPTMALLRVSGEGRNPNRLTASAGAEAN